jgi:hypothetical protein
MANLATSAAVSEAKEARKATAPAAKAAPASMRDALAALAAGDMDYIARPEDTRPAVSAGYISATPAASPAKVKAGYAKGSEAPMHYILVAVASNNPKQPGSKAYAMFEIQRNLIGRTVKEVGQASTRGDVLWNLQRGYITIASPEEAKALGF